MVEFAGLGEFAGDFGRSEDRRLIPWAISSTENSIGRWAGCGDAVDEGEFGADAEDGGAVDPRRRWRLGRENFPSPRWPMLRYQSEEHNSGRQESEKRHLHAFPIHPTNLSIVRKARPARILG